MAAPLGNHNAAKGNRWSHAIDCALKKRSQVDAHEALVELAEKLLAAAEKGDSWAIKELGDRIDGKPAQALTLQGDENKPITIVERKIV